MGTRSRAIGHAVGLNCSVHAYQLAYIQDALDMLIWQNTEDGRDGKNRPQHRTANMTKKQQAIEFDSPEAFEAYRASFFSPPERGD